MGMWPVSEACFQEITNPGCENLKEPGRRPIEESNKQLMETACDVSTRKGNTGLGCYCSCSCTRTVSGILHWPVYGFQIQRGKMSHLGSQSTECHHFSSETTWNLPGLSSLPSQGRFLGLCGQQDRIPKMAQYFQHTSVGVSYTLRWFPWPFSLWMCPSASFTPQVFTKVLPQCQPSCTFETSPLWFT